MTREKKEIIIKLQEAVGRSQTRLKIINNITKKESVKELINRLKISQSTMSKSITRFLTYKLIKLLNKKENSDVYDKVPILKQIGNLDRWIKVKIDEKEEEIKPRIFKLKPKTSQSIPFLDSKIEEDAIKMAEGPYITLYLLENSIRKFIDYLLTNKYKTKEWWKHAVKNVNLLNKVNDRKNLEGINKWHVPRGKSEIFYVDLEDLTYFFNKEKDVFKQYLDIELWTTIIKKMIKLSRNIISHHNPLPKKEITRLNQFLEDWKKQVKDVQS